MAKRPRSGFYSVVLIWAVGLILGVLAGTVTAMLLAPDKPAAIRLETVRD